MGINQFTNTFTEDKLFDKQGQNPVNDLKDKTNFHATWFFCKWFGYSVSLRSFVHLISDHCALQLLKHDEAFAKLFK